MKNINKDILKQLEKDKFNEEILNDPLRLSYYTALKGYLEYLSTANLDGTPQSTAKFKKYNKDLLKIMKTEGHVCHLLVNDLQINRDLYRDTETQYISTGGRYGSSRYKSITIYRLWEDKTKIFSRLDVNKMHDYLYTQIESLFPSLVFVNYKTTSLKESLKLLDMRLDSFSYYLEEEYTSRKNIN